MSKPRRFFNPLPPNPKRPRRGPNQVQVNFLCDKDDLAEFDRNIPAGKRSRALNELIRAFNASKRSS